MKIFYSCPYVRIFLITKIQYKARLTCSNPLGWVNARHACEGGHVTTAVPLPTSVALQTGRALPGAGEQQTFVAGYLQADPEGNEHLKEITHRKRNAKANKYLV